MFRKTHLSLLWSRTLETIGVLVWILMVCLGIVSIPLIVCILFSQDYWHFGIIYLTWIYYDRNTPRNGGRRWNCRWRLPFPKWYAQYFPMKLIKVSELDSNKNYLMACHPHGLLVTGMGGTLATDASDAHLVFAGLKTNFVTLDFLFFIPIFRELLLAVGGCSASKTSISALLQRKKGGNIVLVVPGGAREVFYSRPGTEEIYLKNRKGFVRVAIQNGVPLVPVYTFGENDIYTQLPNPKGSWIRTMQEKCLDIFGVPCIIFCGRGIFQDYFGLLPRRHPITTVVGSPIEVNQMDCPTADYVNQVHSEYCDALNNLYKTNVATYGHPNTELIIN